MAIFIGLVTFDPLQNGEVVLVISELNAIDEPLGKPLLKRWAWAPLPDISGSLSVLIKSMSNIVSGQCPTFLI